MRKDWKEEESETWESITIHGAKRTEYVGESDDLEQPAPSFRVTLSQAEWVLIGHECEELPFASNAPSLDIVLKQRISLNEVSLPFQLEIRAVTSSFCILLVTRSGEKACEINRCPLMCRALSQIYHVSRVSWSAVNWTENISNTLYHVSFHCDLHQGSEIALRQIGHACVSYDIVPNWNYCIRRELQVHATSKWIYKNSSGLLSLSIKLVLWKCE